MSPPGATTAEPAPPATLVRLRRALSGSVLSSLHGYRRSFLTGDLVAALTLLVIAVPEQLATSRLAGMPPITGYYAFIAGSVLFAVVGSNPQLSVGADSTIAPLFFVGISHLAAPGSAQYVDLVGILAVSVGVIVALVGLLRFGWIAQFLSTPIITGFLAGVAVIIVVHQLPDLLGIAPPSGSNLHRIGQILSHLGSTNLWSLVIGVAVLAIVVGAEQIDRRLPGALVALVGSTAAVAIFKLQSHGVAVLGTVARTSPRFSLSGLSLSSVGSVLPLAAVVALVVISQSAATTRAFADKGDYDVDVNRDFVGVGAGSVIAGLVGAFPVNASPPRTAAVVEAGGRTQVTSLAAAGILVVLIPFAGVLRDVPLATLAAVLLFVASRIVHVRDLVTIARFNWFEFGLAGVALLTVALVGVEQGIAVAVGLAILDRTRLSARPKVHVLGRVPGTTSFAPISSAEHAVQVPGVLVLLFATPLWYANALHFRAEIEASLSRAEGPLRTVVLDAIGMSDVDYTGSNALREVLDELDKQHVSFVVARAGERAFESLRRSGLVERIGAERFYGTVGEAVDSVTGLG